MTISDEIQEMTTLKLSWQTINDAVDALAYMVKPLNPHLIVGVARGGLIPATLLSHKLNIGLETISCSTYQGTRRTFKKSTVVEGWKKEYNRDDVLVIDDIMDSGDTYRAILDQVLEFTPVYKFKFATLVKKQEAKFIDFNRFVIQVPQDIWIEFPWENGES